MWLSQDADARIPEALVVSSGGNLLVNFWYT